MPNSPRLLVAAIYPQFDDQGQYIFDEESDFFWGISEAGERVLLFFTDESAARKFARHVKPQMILLETVEAVVDLCRKAKALHNCKTVSVNPLPNLKRLPAAHIDAFISTMLARGPK